jgi:hypothetical protein
MSRINGRFLDVVHRRARLALLDGTPQCHRPPEGGPERAVNGLFELAFYYAVQNCTSEHQRLGSQPADQLANSSPQAFSCISR